MLFQRIGAREIEFGLKYFGQAIDGHMDLGDDGLPDIVVGSKGAAVVLRYGFCKSYPLLSVFFFQETANACPLVFLAMSNRRRCGDVLCFHNYGVESSSVHKQPKNTFTCCLSGPDLSLMSWLTFHFNLT